MLIYAYRSHIKLYRKFVLLVSALEKEKGLFREFKDSLTAKKVHVYVDNLTNQKIKVVYNDSSKLYINFTDSLKTQELFTLLKGKIVVPD